MSRNSLSNDNGTGLAVQVVGEEFPHGFKVDVRAILRDEMAVEGDIIGTWGLEEEECEIGGEDWRKA